MIAVYIASPYTKGDVAVNVRNSFIVADELVKLGYAPFPPLFSHFWHFLSPKPYETWTTLDKEWVLRCDCVLRLEGEPFALVLHFLNLNSKRLKFPFRII